MKILTLLPAILLLASSAALADKITIPWNNTELQLPGDWNVQLSNDVCKVIEKSLKTLNKLQDINTEELDTPSQNAIILFSAVKKSGRFPIARVDVVLQTDKEFINMGQSLYIDDTLRALSESMIKFEIVSSNKIARISNIDFRAVEIIKFPI